MRKTLLPSNTNKPNETRSPRQHEIIKTVSALALVVAALTLMASKAVAVFQSIAFPSPAMAWCAHFLSVLTIAGCLAAERVLVETGMTLEEEQNFHRMDSRYSLLMVLLIGSCLAKSLQGGDVSVQEALFWVKLGVWGGLSVLPAIVLRDLAEHDRDVLHENQPRQAGTIQAETMAIAFLPLLAILMSHEVANKTNLTLEMGALLSFVASVACFLYYCASEGLLTHNKKTSF